MATNPKQEPSGNQLDDLFAKAAEADMARAKAPSADELWMQLEAKLETQPKAKYRILPFWWYSVAATIFLALGIGFYLQIGQYRSQSVIANNSGQLLLDDTPQASNRKGVESKPMNGPSILSKVPSKSQDNKPSVVMQDSAQAPIVTPPIIPPIIPLLIPPIVDPIEQIDLPQIVKVKSQPTERIIEIEIDVRPSSKRDIQLTELEPQLEQLPQAPPTDKYRTPNKQGSWFTRLNDIRKGRVDLITSPDSTRPTILQRLSR